MSTFKKWVPRVIYVCLVLGLFIFVLFHLLQGVPASSAMSSTSLLAQINDERAQRLTRSRAASVFIYADVADKRLYREPTLSDAFRDGRKIGAGVMTPGGRILTAAHVVEGVCMSSTSEPSSEVYCAVVGVGHKEVYRAKVIKIIRGVSQGARGAPMNTAEAFQEYPGGDLAELQIVAPNHREAFAAVPVIDPIYDRRLEGREVLINGMPFGYANMAVLGMVSNAPDRDEVCPSGSIRVTITAGTGNSGGAVFDLGTGALIGIVSTVKVLERGSKQTLFLHIMCAVSPQQIRAFME